MYGLRFSTLQCLYSRSCLEKLAAFLDINYVLQPLNDLIPTRFTPISTISISALIDQLFIEIWQNSSNYSNYYSACAPMKCQYTYNKRNNLIYIIASLLGLYGGLTIGLKLVIWHILNIFWKFYEKIKKCQANVHPSL